MKAITYHPIGDPYHCSYRILSIMGHSTFKEYHIEKLRILDFYCLFPSLLKKIRRTKELISAIKQIEPNVLDEPYQILPSPSILFRQVEGVQQTAINHLVSKNFLDLEAYKKRTIKISQSEEQIEIAQSVFYKNTNHALISMLTTELDAIGLHGANGLKARTGLLDFRYDNA